MHLMILRAGIVSASLKTKWAGKRFTSQHEKGKEKRIKENSLVGIQYIFRK